MVTIDACQLLSAIENGLNFFHNEYSGLVFGVGKRKGDGNWDLEIPISFFFNFIHVDQGSSVYPACG